MGLIQGADLYTAWSERLMVYNTNFAWLISHQRSLLSASLADIDQPIDDFKLLLEQWLQNGHL
jgi:hypothetical protein